MDGTESINLKDPSKDQTATGTDANFDYDLQQNIGFLLRKTNQFAVSRFNSYMKNILRINDVTTTQFAVISTLARFRKMTFSELSTFTSVDLPTLNALVKRLDDRDILSVAVKKTDKRSRQISLTKNGAALADDLTSQGNRIGDFITEKLTPNEIKRLRKLLNKLRDGS